MDAESVKSIDATVYQILEEIGLSQAPESGIKYMTDTGAVLGDDGRVRFPRALVEDTLSKCARNINLYGQDSKHDILLSGSACITERPVRRFTSWMWKRMNKSYLADIYDALLTKWIISIFCDILNPEEN